jgi:hypothetical protein
MRDDAEAIRNYKNNFIIFNWHTDSVWPAK